EAFPGTWARVCILQGFRKNLAVKSLKQNTRSPAHLVMPYSARSRTMSGRFSRRRIASPLSVRAFRSVVAAMGDQGLQPPAGRLAEGGCGPMQQVGEVAVGVVGPGQAPGGEGALAFASGLGSAVLGH